MENEISEWIDVEETCKMLGGIDKSTLWRWVKSTPVFPQPVAPGKFIRAEIIAYARRKPYTPHTLFIDSSPPAAVPPLGSDPEVDRLNAETELVKAQIKNAEAKQERDKPEALKQREAELADGAAKLNEWQASLVAREEALKKSVEDYSRLVPCPRCGGGGHVMQAGDYGAQVSAPCPACEGAGKLPTIRAEGERLAVIRAEIEDAAREVSAITQGAQGRASQIIANAERQGGEILAKAKEQAQYQFNAVQHIEATLRYISESGILHPQVKKDMLAMLLPALHYWSLKPEWDANGVYIPLKYRASAHYIAK